MKNMPYLNLALWSSQSYTFSVTGNKTLVANFTQQTFSVTVAVNPSTCGTVSGTGTYLAGVEARLTATAYANCRFDNWKEGNIIVETNPVFRFVVSSPKAITANFTPINAVSDLNIENVKVFPNPNNGQFDIKFETPTTENYTFSIHNLLGQVLQKGRIAKGVAAQHFQLSDVAKGVYMLQLQGETQKQAIKLLIE